MINWSWVRSYIIMGGVLLIIIFIAKNLPGHAAITVEPPKVVTKTIYKDREVTKEVIVYKSPDQWEAAQDAKAICNGSKPIQIVQMDVSEDKDNKNTTWVLGRPIGSNVNITCYLAGDMRNFWKVGMLVMTNTVEVK